MRTRTSAVLLLVPVVSLALASCGDDDGRLSKGEFVDQMNALCKERERKIEFLDEVNVFNPEDGATALQRAKGPVETFAAEVRDLKPPKDAEDVYGDYVDSLDGVLDEVDGLVAAGKAGQLKTYSQRLLQLFNTTDGIDKAMDDYGTKDCFDEDEALPPVQKPEPGATPFSVSAKEYTFEIPAVGAGKAAFTLHNEGEEIHVFGFGKLKDGVTFEQVRVAAAGDDFDPSKLFDGEFGPTAPAAPDGSAVLNADMQSGSYVAFCFIPAPDGKPHLQKGMLVPFDVT